MTIRIILDKSFKDPMNKRSILTPNENQDHIIVKKAEGSESKYIFYLPFRIHTFHSVKNNLNYEIETIRDLPQKRISLLDPDLLSPTKEQLDYLNLLPGQINFNIDSTNRQIYRRNQNTEITVKSLTKTINKINPNLNLNQSSNIIDKLKDKKVEIFEYFNKKNNILTNLLEGDNVAKKAVMFNKTKTIKKYKLDYTKNISNSLAKKIKNSRNQEEVNKFLKKENRVYFGAPHNPGIDISTQVFYSKFNIGANFIDSGGSNFLKNPINLTQTSLTKNNTTNQALFSRNYQKKIDPAVLFEGIPTHRSAINHKKGTFPKLGIKNTGKKGRGLVFKNMNLAKSLKQNLVDKNLLFANNLINVSDATISQGFGKIGTFSLNKRSSKRDNLPFAYIKKIIKQYELIYFKHTLDLDNLPKKFKNERLKGNFEIKMNVNIYNNKNLKLAEKKFSFNPIQIISEQLSIPDSAPTLNVVKIKNKNFLKVEIINSSKRPIKYRLYRKFIDYGVTKDRQNKFQQIHAGDIKEKNYINFKINQVSNIDSLYRLTYEVIGLNSSANYNNFVNDIIVLKNDNNTKKDVMMNTRVVNASKTRVGIAIEVDNIPPDVVSLRLLKRNASLCKSHDASNRMQKMEYVKDINDITKNQTFDVLSQNTITFFDQHVKDSNVYEYQVEMHLARGTKRRSSLRVREEYVDKNDDSINMNALQDMILSNSNNTSLQKLIFKKDNLSTSISIENSPIFNFKKNETMSEKFINNAIKNVGMNNIYAKELNDIKETANIISGINLVLRNKTNGNVEEIGDINSGDNIQDLITLLKNNKYMEIKAKCDYDIIAKGYESSPVSIFENLTKIVKSSESLLSLKDNTNQFGERKKAIMTKLSKNKKKSNFNVKKIQKNRGKFFNKRKLKRGVITSTSNTNDALGVSKINKDIIEKNFTGAITTFSIGSLGNRLNVNNSLSPISTYVSPTHRIVISFKLSTTSQTDLDFIIITAEKDGDFFPVGSAHIHNDGDETITFLDYTNVDYLGEIKYYGQIVTNEGICSDKQYIGKVLLIKKIDNINLLKDSKF